MQAGGLGGSTPAGSSRTGPASRRRDHTVYQCGGAQSFGDAVVAQAATHYGAPYRWGGSGPNTFDCSGLVMVVFGHFGVRLPHYTVDQYAVSRHIPQNQKQPGDVIFFHDSTGYIYHDGIYAGNNTIIAAPHTGDVVRRETLWTGAYYVGRY